MARCVMFIFLLLAFKAYTFDVGPDGSTMEEYAARLGMKENNYLAYLDKLKELKVLIAKINNLKIDEKKITNTFGDMIFSVSQMEKIIEMFSSKESRRKKRKVLKFLGHNKWDVSKPIKYIIDTNYTKFQMGLIRKAIGQWQSKTCIQFQEEDESRLNQIQEYYLVFLDQSSRVGGLVCSAHLGIDNKKRNQDIFLPKDGCVKQVSFTMHEIGHSFGLIHEHTRTDRDKFIKIFSEKMMDQGRLDYALQGISDTLGLPYDYGSIMHYGPFAYALLSEPVIEASDELYQSSLGQEVELSFYDAKVINLVYCKDLIDKCDRKCKRGGIPHPRSCKCVCPDGFGGPTCETAGEHSEGCTTPQIIIVDSKEQCVNSPNYGRENYPINSICNWHLKAAKGLKIQLEFKGKFDVYCAETTEICHHWVEIKYKGNFDYPGHRFCCQSKHPTLYTDTNFAVISFKALSSGAIEEKRNKGFKLCFKAIKKAPGFCESSPCQNKGKCLKKKNRCKCKKPFTGKFCEIKQNAITTPPVTKKQITKRTTTTPKVTTTRNPCPAPLQLNNGRFCGSPNCDGKLEKTCNRKPKCICGKNLFWHKQNCIRKLDCQCIGDYKKSQKKDYYLKTPQCRRCIADRCIDRFCTNNKIKTSIYLDNKEQGLRLQVTGLTKKQNHVLWGSGKSITFERGFLITITHPQNLYMTVFDVEFKVKGATGIKVLLSVKGSPRPTFSFTPGNADKIYPVKISSYEGNIPHDGLDDVDFIELRFTPPKQGAQVVVSDLMVQVCPER